MSDLSEEETFNYPHAKLSPLLIGLSFKVFLKRTQRRKIPSQFSLHAFSMYSLQTIADIRTKEMYMRFLQEVCCPISLLSHPLNINKHHNSSLSWSGVCDQV